MKNSKIKGNIHSFETMGLHDGPGIRTVIFFQGCPLRCKYCHNPDTWDTGINHEYTIDQIVNKVLPYKNYFNASDGGVTFSGGEPLLQTDFIIELAKRFKKEGIHTTLDTSGIGNGNYDELLKYIDLVLLDIKHPTDEGFYNLTGVKNTKLFNFIKAINDSNTKSWIRNVIINDFNDSDEYLYKFKEFTLKIKNVEKIEFLAFHKMCLSKYHELDIEFPFRDLEETDDDKVIEMQKKLIDIKIKR